MLNTRELEKRWLKYKIKSYIPHAVILLSIVVIGIIALVVSNTNNTQQDNKPKVAKVKQIQQSVKKVPQQETSQPVAAVKQKETNNTRTTLIAKTPILHQKSAEKLTLAPSMNFIKHIQNEEQQPYYKTLHKTKKIVKSAPKKKRNKVVQQPSQIEEEYLNVDQKQQPKVQKQAKIEKKHIITIERRDSQNDIQEIIARFEKNNNPALSLFVAKKYYELGDYEQAYNYALITNDINNNIEDSWLIFAKSLVKLHKRELAIKTLREYIKYSHSGNAKILFDDIRSGKFQ